MRIEESRLRVVEAVAGRRDVRSDPAYEIDLAAALRSQHNGTELMALFRRFGQGESWFDGMMRRVCFRALVRRCGVGLQVGVGISLRHAGTFTIGDGVFIGDHALLHGRHDGCFIVGDRVWIGPQCFLDARDLVLGDHVGLGTGTRVLGSRDAGLPIDVPIVTSDPVISSVRIHDGADIGVGAILMPGVTVGAGAIVDAGAVVTRDIPPLTKAAGIPARVVGWRTNEGPEFRDQEVVHGGQA